MEVENNARNRNTQRNSQRADNKRFWEGFLLQCALFSSFIISLIKQEVFVIYADNMLDIC